MTIGKPTEAQVQQREQESRLVAIFYETSAQEKMAKSYEDKGDAAMALAWRNDLARHSGLTASEADAVKKIGSQYILDLQAASDNITARSRSVVASHHGSAEVAELQEARLQREALFSKLKTDLLTALGSRSYTRLDSYALHRHDNAKMFYQQTVPAIPAAEVSKTGVK